MSEERVDIVITDKVASSIGSKLQDIANEARKAYADITGLQNSLNSLSSGNVVSLATATQTLASAQSKASASASNTATQQEKLNTAILKSEAALNTAAAAEQKLFAASAQALTQTQNLATAVVRTSIAQTDAASATQNLAAAQARANAASSQSQAAQTQAAIAAQRLQVAQAAVGTASTNSATAQARLASATATAAAANTRAGTAATQSATANQQLAIAQNNVQRSSDLAALAALRLANAQTRATQATTASGAAATHVGSVYGSMAQKNQIAAVQLKDFFEQVVAGGNPLRAFALQGAQVVTIYGGVGNALTAIGELFTPIVVAAGAAALAVGAYAFALYEGQKQSKEFNDALTVTGNFAGLTEGRFNALVKTTAEAAHTTVGSARDIGQALISTGEISATVFDKAIVAASAYSKVTGKTAEETAKFFAKIAESPSKAAEEINKSMHLLSLSQYQAIKSFEETGHAADAQGIILDALAKRFNETQKNLGYLDRALQTSKGWWSSFWDSAFDVGRTETIEDKISKAEKAVSDMQKRRADVLAGNQLRIAGQRPSSSANEIAAIDAKIAETTATREAALEVQRLQRRSAAAQAEDALIQQEGINSEKTLDHYKKKGRAVSLYIEKQNEATAAIAKQDKALLARGEQPTSAADKAAIFAGVKKEYGEKPGPKAPKTDEQKAIERYEKELAALKKKNYEIENTTHLEAFREQVEAGLYEHITPKLIAGIEAEKQRQDVEEKSLALTKFIAEKEKEAENRSKARTKAIEDQTISIKAQTEEYQNEARALFASEETKIALDTIRKVSIEQAKLGTDTTAAETAAIWANIAALKAQGSAKAELAQKQFLAQNSNLDTSAGGNLFEFTEEAARQQAEIYRQMYARIDAMRQNEVISVQTAEIAKNRIRAAEGAKQSEMALTIFGSLATLQRSKSKELAFIGKAAAVSEATIKAYLAINTALASLPPPANFAVAAAIGAAAFANVASIISTPAGFQQGGYTGDGALDEAKGIVHAREFVVNAEGTANNRWALEAMNKGHTINNSGPNISFQNLGTPQSYQVERMGDNDIRIIARDEVNKALPNAVPQALASDLENPNSRSSKAISRSFEVSRNRS